MGGRSGTMAALRYPVVSATLIVGLVGAALWLSGLESIWLGIALSVGLMLVAAFGFIPATVGAGIQEVVDLATILNALRALRSREVPTRG